MSKATISPENAKAAATLLDRCELPEVLAACGVIQDILYSPRATGPNKLAFMQYLEAHLEKVVTGLLIVGLYARRADHIRLATDAELAMEWIEMSPLALRARKVTNLFYGYPANCESLTEDSAVAHPNPRDEAACRIYNQERASYLLPPVTTEQYLAGA